MGFTVGRHDKEGAGAPEPETLDLLEKQVGRYQLVIGRLSGYGVQVKTWCVTVAAAAAALAANNDKPELFVVGIVAAVGFSLLDAFALSVERHFRHASDALVDKVVAGEEPEWPSFFKLEPPRGTRHDWRLLLKAGKSLTIAPFYGLVAGALAAGLVLSL